MSLIGLFVWLCFAWFVLQSLRAGYRSWTGRANNPVRRLAQWSASTAVFVISCIPLYCFLTVRTLEVGEHAQYESLVISIDAGYGKIQHGNDVVLVRVEERSGVSVRRVVGLPGDPVKDSWGRFYRDSTKERIRSLPKGYVAVALVNTDGEENDIQIVAVQLIKGRVWFAARIYSW
jgi:hypothetical protein